MQARYSIITAARDEAEALPRLAAALRAQSCVPTEWLIVENGSTDSTPEVATALAKEYEWVRLVRLVEQQERQRGAPIVRALSAGISALSIRPDVLVNVDADVSMDEDYFERLLEAFAENDRLGIASGSAWELDRGEWRQRFVTGGTVWGATRAYRWECLQDVLPFHERHGWDGIDQLTARARGWETRTLVDLPFRHHRPEGSRDGTSWAHWVVNGKTAHYMGYRAWYLAARTAHRMRRDPAAAGLLWGFAVSAMRRSAQVDDQLRAVLRDDQSVGRILQRRREALGFDPNGSGSTRNSQAVSGGPP